MKRMSSRRRGERCDIALRGEVVKDSRERWGACDRRSNLALLVLLMLHGCEFIAPSGVFECEGAIEGECPPNYRCVKGLCVDPDEPPGDEEGDCPAVAAPKHGSVELPNPPFRGDRATVRCDEEKGYQLVGDEMLFCQEDGEWSAPIPRCELMTCPPGKEISPEPMHCWDCPEGTFSSAHDRAPCQPWTTCELYALEAVKPSASNDRQCLSRWVIQVDESPYELSVSAMEVGLAGTLYLGGNQYASSGFLVRHLPLDAFAWTGQSVLAEASVQDIATTPDGYVYAVGYTDAALQDQSALGGRDGFVMRFNGYLEWEWTRQFGTAVIDIANGVDVGPDGSIYVVGGTFGALPGQVATGNVDAYVMKLTATGEVSWIRQFGSEGVPPISNALAVSVDSNGDIYVAGITTGDLLRPDASLRDVFVRKYTSDGELDWQSGIATPFIDEVHAVRTAPNGTVFVAGSTFGSFDEFGSVDEEGPSETRKAFIVNFQGSNGSIRFVDFIDTRDFMDAEAHDWATDVRVTPNGKVYVFGYGAPLDGPSFEEAGFIREYALEDGRLNWTHTFGAAPGMLTVDAGAIGEDGSIFVSGTIRHGSFPGQEPSGDSADAYVVGFMASEGH